MLPVSTPHSPGHDDTTPVLTLIVLFGFSLATLGVMTPSTSALVMIALFTAECLLAWTSRVWCARVALYALAIVIGYLVVRLVAGTPPVEFTWTALGITLCGVAGIILFELGVREIARMRREFANALPDQAAASSSSRGDTQ